jgi:hypothetical protein
MVDDVDCIGTLDDTGKHKVLQQRSRQQPAGKRAS